MSFLKGRVPRLMTLVKNGDLKGLRNELNTEPLSDKTGYGLVHLAVAENRIDIVEELLQHGCRVTDENGDDFQNSPVRIAVSKGNFEMVDLLVSNGADQMTAMYLIPESVLQSGDDVDELIIRVKKGWLHGVQELLEVVEIPGDLKFEIVRLAVKLSKLEIVEELLNHGFKVLDKRCQHVKKDPLSIAISHEDFEMVDLLVSHGADSVAALCLLPEKLLISGDDIDKLVVYVRKGKLKEVTELLRKVELDQNLGYQIVRLAVLFNHIEIVEALVKYGCKVSLEDTTHFHNSPLHLAILRKNLEMGNLLLNNGADILIAFCLLSETDFENGDELHELIFNIKQGNLTAVKKLLEIVEISEKMGYAMVRLAVICNHLLIVEELLKHDCKVNIENQSNPTPLDIAISKQDPPILRLLQCHGAKTLNGNLLS